MLRWTPIILPIFALLAICLRGIIAERIGELSLYFRWQYMLAAARIIVAHPIFGTGPAGFKDQYLLHKEPTNPEEIDSPHCLPMDWLATMGLFGAAWVILWVVWLLRAGATASAVGRGGSPCTPATADSARRLAALAVAPALIIFGSLGFSWWAEWAAMLPEMLGVYAVAGLAWWLVVRTGSRLTKSDPRALDIALFGAIVVLGTHCMIEVTGVFTSSVGWVMAAAALAGKMNSERSVAEHTRLSKLWPILTLFAAGTTALSGYGRFVSEVSLRLAAFEARDMGHDPRSYSWQARAKDAAGLLDRANFNLLWQFEARCAIIEFHAGLPEALYEFGSHARSSVRTPQAAPEPRSSGTRARVALLLENRANLFASEDGLSDACTAWLRVASLDPHGLTPPLHLARLYAQLDQPEEAAPWARRALQIHDNLHLDPLKGLTDAEKAEMEHLAGR